MGMDNIFMHDAVPTWSGFLYQGRIAVYLAVRKINEWAKLCLFRMEMRVCRM